MRKLRLLTTLRGPEGDVPPGAEIVVADVEARRLLGAIGLAEDLGEVAPELKPEPPEKPPEKPAKKPG